MWRQTVVTNYWHMLNKSRTSEVLTLRAPPLNHRPVQYQSLVSCTKVSQDITTVAPSWNEHGARNFQILAELAPGTPKRSPHGDVRKTTEAPGKRQRNTEEGRAPNLPP